MCLSEACSNHKVVEKIASPSENQYDAREESFYLDVDSATILVSTAALSNDLNDYVFARPDAPLKKLIITTHIRTA
jgi:hypothetical protein